MQKLLSKKQLLQLIPWLLLGVVGSLLTLLIPSLVQGLLDGSSTESVTPKIIQIIVLLAVQLVVTFVAHVALLNIGEDVIFSYRKRVYHALVAGDISLEKRSGEYAGLLLESSKKIRDFLVFSLPQFLQGAVTVIGIVVMLFVLNWQLTLVILVGIPLMFVFLIPMSGFVAKVSQKEQEQSAGVIGQLGEYIAHQTFFVANNAVEESEQHLEKSFLNLRKVSYKLGTMEAVAQPFAVFLITLVMSLIFLFGGYLLATGAMTIGTFVSFLIYIFMLLTPASALASFMAEVSKVQGSMQELLPLLEKTKVASAGVEAPDLSNTSVTIDHVSVSYGEKEVLHDVTFTVEPGKSIAIVGPSGSGKTTTMQALLGMLTPTSGDVLLGTQSLTKTDVTTYRSQIGYLSQNEQLLTGTVLENLSWGLQDVPATQAVEEALRQAEILEDIQALPQGVNTPVSEIGSNFSGGQAQRIGLARILLRNPSLLLLDEATSAMDSVVEYKVMQTLQEKLPNTTKVMIAHRLASVQNADEILFMEEGQITGKGTHKSLLQTHPRYQEFVEKQMIEQ